MFEKYSNKYLTERLNKKEQNLADLLADDVSDYLGDTMDYDEFSSMDQEEKEDVVNNALGKLSDKYYNDGDFDKDLDKLMNRKYKEVTSYIASQLSEGIEMIEEARGAKVTQFTKPGKDGDIYFSKREGNAVGVRQGDLLQMIYVYDGEVKLGKVQKTDKRWENMGEPTEKLLIDLKLKNVGGLNTRDTATNDGKLIYKFLSESVNEGQFSWLTHDGQVQIGSDPMNRVVTYMYDDKGNKWEEKRYEGYGEFGGKDYYDLVATMNGYTEEDLKDKKLLKKAKVIGKPELRQLGIAIAFNNLKPKTGKKPLFPALVVDPRLQLENVIILKRKLKAILIKDGMTMNMAMKNMDIMMNPLLKPIIIM